MESLQNCPETGEGSCAPEGCARRDNRAPKNDIKSENNYSKKRRKKTELKKAKCPEYVLRTELKFARHHHPELAKLPHKKLFHYLRFVKAAALGNQHEHVRFSGHLSITWQELERRFGQKRFHAINDAIGFLDCTHWSKDKSYTRGFRLTQDGEMFIDALLSQKSETEDYLVDAEMKKLIKAKRNGRSSRDMDGNNAAWRCTAPSSCRVDVKSVQKGMKCLQDCRDFFNGYAPIPDYGPFNRLERPFKASKTLSPEKRRAEWIRRRMAAMHWIHGAAHSRSLPFGFVATDYIESPSGRLYAATDFHLQNTPREVRKIALAGNWDYDFKNCHYSILQQLAHRYGIEVPAIDGYVADTKGVREALSRDIGLEIADVKKCLLALIYGARRSHRGKDAIPDVIGVEKAEQLYEHEIFNALMDEVKLAGKAAIEKAERKGNGKGKEQSVILNAMGKSISAKESQPCVLAHLVQGIEARMLHTVVEMYQEEVLLLQHDGWTADRELDVDFIEDEIERETGFKMVVEMEQLEPWG